MIVELVASSVSRFSVSSNIFRFRIFSIELVYSAFTASCVEVLFRQLGLLAVEAAQPGNVAIGEVDRRIDPLPALFGLQRSGVDLQLFEDELLKKCGIFEPAALILFEQIPHDRAAGGLICLGADIDCTPIGGTDRGFREKSPDIVPFLVIGSGQRIPDLLLAGMIVADRERLELVEFDLILFVEIEKLWRNDRQLQALFDDERRHEEAGRDLRAAAPGRSGF